MTVLSILGTGLQSYNQCIQKRPVLTKSCTSAVTGIVGDVLSQLISGKSFALNSTINYALYGFFFTGPITHNFYKLLELLFPASLPRNWIRRLLFERLAFAPIFLFITLYILARLDGKTHNATTRQMKLSYWMALKMNWKIWTPFQFFNITYVPIQYRPLFANLVAVGWIIYIAKKRRQAASKGDSATS
ncbi:peroxisomal membrane protein 2-like [Oratosquilla oratoria]|uniref:peroxisomal membrane protein 2-like n=1 Tax=Oratosquilla oratoria TaxID=337810 RepID=UPI003F76BE90